MKLSLIICFILCSLSCLESAKILGVFHMAAYSHYQLGDKLFTELAARGHEVTVVSPYVQKKEVKNLKQIVLTGFAEHVEAILMRVHPMTNKQKKFLAIKAELYDQSNENPILSAIWLYEFGTDYVNKTFSHPNVQKLLRSNEKFDLVIVEQFVNEAFKGFCYHYQAPCVVVQPLAAGRWSNGQMGNPGSPSYVVDMGVKYDSHMNFFQRIYNTYVYTVSELYFHLFVIPKQNEVLQNTFPGSPHLYDLHYNTSLMLLNAHLSVHAPTPRVPNMIDIGGYHVNPPKKLPEDLQTFLDDSKNGVVYFSMGSNLKSSNMPIEKRNAILKTFSKLKYRVLWKWENETLPEQPSNVKLSKWLPQQDVLAHPNVKLFISHGGILSTIESIYHGVPILVMPVFGDQDLNAANAELAGYAVKLSYHQLTQESFSRALNEILSNPKYSENAKLRSNIMHDQPLKPLDRAMFWIEYVLRHKGAPHLRTAATSLMWYQYLLLDVSAFFVTIVALLLYLLCKAVKFVCCRGKKTEKLNIKKKKN